MGFAMPKSLDVPTGMADRVAKPSRQHTQTHYTTFVSLNNNHCESQLVCVAIV